MPIQVLPDDVVARIAAGEVVERPASVVKELLENSIDAGADAIHVEVSESGRRLIRISDNGSGIGGDEVELAFTRHATSKLRTSDDLERLSTLGFRGEALSSIAAVSHTTVITRQREEKMGSSLYIQGGIVQQRKAVGAPAGTVITIENLFYNTPARLKFLKSDNTEKRQIQTVISRYAMAYPNIRFVLKQDGREQFRSSGTGELADVVVKVLGLENFRHLVEVSSEEVPHGGYPKIGVYGYVSEPSLNRNDRSRLIMFINGRSIQDNALNHAVTQAYHTLVETGRYPYAVLLLTMPPDFVDVNVHPTKAEVRFRDANQVFVAVQRAVRRAILDFADTTGVETIRQGEDWYQNANASLGRKTQMNMSLESPDFGRFVERDIYDDDADLDYIPEGAGQSSKPRTLPLLRVVGQIGATYIVAEGPAGMYLIDQNAAHERILYESLRVAIESDKLETTFLQESVSVLLSPEQATQLQKYGEEFSRIGFEIEVFGPNTFVVRAIPDAVIHRPIDTAIEQILAYIKTVDKVDTEDFVMALALVSAVKSGQVMSIEEMQALIRQLERCPSPHDSPTGQATMIHMSREHLAREFGRS